MSAVPVLRLAPKPRPRRKAKGHACCNQAHAFAAAEIAIRKGCLCGDFCLGAGRCVGLVVRRLRPVPGGFVEVTS